MTAHTSDNIRVLITGGGTGGHVFPAIAIADALKQLKPKTEILFVGAAGKLEMTKVPEAGYQIIGLNISGIQRDSVLKNISLPFKMIGSLLKACSIVRTFRPQVVVGVGGYASGPTMYAAYLYKIPIVIQEQNRFAGVTNRLFADKAHKFCVAYEGMEQFFPKEKIVLTGNPVRQQLSAFKSNKTQSLRAFNLSENRKTVLAVGGSLGARTINESISAGLEKIENHNLQLIWQTGKNYFTEAQSKASGYGAVKVFDFIKNIDQAYDAADVIISRAGAIAVSELCLVGKPVILIPSPNVAEDHQTKNAEALVKKNAAILVKDHEARAVLIDALIDLLHDEPKQKILADNISKLAVADAANKIACEIFRLIEKNSQ
jgi:UDP-N-acetylglucosamine--N-acetylmuramyl-(pentapeptide) pyrophosphoryl-undecaprenol N-acetylglucosamine transferase